MDTAVYVRGENSALPVLYISGYTRESLDTRGLLTQRTAMIEKPFRLAALCEAIAGMLRSGRAPVSATRTTTLANSTLS